LNEQSTDESTQNHPQNDGSRGYVQQPQGQPYTGQQGQNGQQNNPQPPTQQSFYNTPLGQVGRERFILAAILIGAGLFIFLQQIIPFNFGDFVLPIIGGAFIAAYLNTRAAYRLGFLIPGCILLGIGVGNLLQRYSFLGNWGGIDVAGLALGIGFCLIWVLERRQWWALIPGGILVASSLANFWVLTKLWPIALIGLGAYLLYDQYRRRQKA
jgi:hypothetical protein